MDDATSVASLSWDVEDVTYAIADEDFRGDTRPYGSTLYGTVQLFVDGDAVTHPNTLPAEFDLLDTVRAQRELVESLQATGSGEVYPFCCPCGDRGCASVRWSITEVGDDDVTVAMQDLIERRIGEGSYRMAKSTLYAGFGDLWTQVLESCRDHDVERFDWASRMSTPVSGREHYATTAEIAAWTTELEGFVSA